MIRLIGLTIMAAAVVKEIKESKEFEEEFEKAKERGKEFRKMITNR